MNLITRADLDGVMCAVIITQAESVARVTFANPNDIEDGGVKVERGDAIANLPFHPNAALWFDHHDRAEDAPRALPNIKGKRGVAPSTSRLVFDYYDDPRVRKFAPIVAEVDRIDSAQLTMDDVSNPQGWMLLAVTLDPFMGLSAFHGYANAVISAIKLGSHIQQILDMPEVRGRITRYRNDAGDFEATLKQVSRLDGDVLITDARDVMMPTGNRFLAFALYPDAAVQVVLTTHSERQVVRVRLGKSIFNRSCEIHLGKLAAEYGGGGLDGAAGCLLDPAVADEKVAGIISKLKAG